MRHNHNNSRESGSSILVAIGTLGVLIAFVSLAVDYSSNVGTNAQRDRVFNSAVEIGDGCLELAFGSWRKLSGISENPPTSTFSTIPTPSPGMFPSFPQATIANFRVQAVDPLMTLSSDNPPISALATTTPPPKTSGPGSGTFSYFYLASVDVTLPYKSGNLTAKVRRVFEKRYTSAWNWAMLYNGDLELHPNSPLTLDGWVHTNNNAYIGNGATPPPSPTPDADGVTPDPTPYPTPPQLITLTDRLTFAGSYNSGYHPDDPRKSTHTNVADAITPADLPPGTEQVYYPFGWKPDQFDKIAGNSNDDGFREMIEKPVSGTDPFATDRLYNQAAIAVEIDASNNVKVYQGTTATKSDVTGQTGNSAGGTANVAVRGDGGGVPSVVTNRVIRDTREGGFVRVVDFDVARFMQTYGSNTYRNWNGIIHIRDNSSGTSVSVPNPDGSGTTVPTTRRAIRIINGSKVPTGGMTIVSDNPVYIQGDFNSGRVAGSAEPPSNIGDPEDPDASGYTRRPASVMADAITLLSNSWNDGTYNTADLTARAASNTTVNAALVAGNVPTGGGSYSGGGENFVRFLEDWSGKTFTYYGAMMNMYSSKHAVGKWGSGNVYESPALKWHFDKSLSVDGDGNPVKVPGYISTVAYLQQQRWYLQY